MITSEESLRLMESGPGSLMSPCDDVADRLDCSSCIHCGSTLATHRMAGNPNATTRIRVCSARLREVPPAKRKYSQTNPESCGLSTRLTARQKTPASTNRSLRKHQTATTQRPTAIPAVLPTAKRTSLLASKRQIKTRETACA